MCQTYFNCVFSVTPLWTVYGRKKAADEAICVKKGGISVIFQPPFLLVVSLSKLVLVVSYM